MAPVVVALAVSEIFGPTFQGEGPDAGKLCWFLRLGGCNLTCTWCDTPWTWDASRFDLRKEITNIEVSEVARRLGKAHRLVITGGEPLLQEHGIGQLLGWLRQGLPVEIETNGTKPPPVWADLVSFNVSPKLIHSGAASVTRMGWNRVPSARFKIVVQSVDDLVAAGEIFAGFGVTPDRCWIMPEGITAEDTLRVAREVADAVIERGWNLSLRQHVLLWGNERGR